MKESPLVSVIVPVYNVEKFLKDCVDSIRTQTYGNLEIILVDDGSPDASGKLCDEFAKQDSRVRVVHKANGGLNMARKSGFKVSTGAWIAFVDSDDVIDSRYISALLEASHVYKTEVSVCGFAYFQDNINKDEKEPSFTFRTKDEVTKLYLTDTRPDNIFFLQTAWAKLFSRRLIEGVDWSECDYRSNEDELMSIYYYRDIRSGVSFVNSQLYHYRQNPDSIMGKAAVEYKNYYKGQMISRIEFLEHVYRKRLAAFGHGYKDEIVYFFSMHFMAHVNNEYRKNPSYILSDDEAELYNSRLEDIRLASKKHPYYGEYGDIYRAIEETGDIRTFFVYRKQHPLVSIIIPVYNVEAYLEECLNSVVAQTYQNLEIILVDDGSPDASGKLCDEFAKQDSRVKVIHKENGGVSSARNRGISEAHGEYIMFVDGDDILADNAATGLIMPAVTGGIDIVFGDSRPYHSEGYFGDTPKRDIPHRQIFTCKESDSDTIYNLLVATNSAFNKLYKSHLLIGNKITFPEDLKIAEDLVFVTEAFFTAKTLYFTGEALYYYRTDFDNEHSAIGGISEEKAFDFGVALKYIESFLGDKNYLRKKQVKDALLRAVVTHSLYALDIVERDATVHRKVFTYLRDDVFTYFNIEIGVIDSSQRKKTELIVENKYDEYILARLREVKAYLYNRLDAIGWLERDVEREIGARDETIAQLRGEIAYLKSTRGMIRTPLSKVKQRIQRMIRR